VAALLRAGLQLPRLSIMGGKTAPVAIDGVTPTIDEWNWHCDPDAVATLLGQGPPSAGLPRVFPAEITFRTPISPADHAALAGETPCVGPWPPWLRSGSGSSRRSGLPGRRSSFTIP
jgi:hypothetical protein